MRKNSNKFFCTLAVIFFIFLNNPIYAMQPRVVFAKNLQIWTESFGDKKNPPILLIMGAGAQGLFWPQQFCEDLANKGYYVIRYDHRDTGLSSSINFRKSPYSVLNLAEDAVYILDNYGIKHAHIVGASMGGEVAVVMAAHYPHYVATLTLLATSTDMSPIFDGLQEKAVKSVLSRPKPIVFEAAKKMINPPADLQGKVDILLENIRAKAGSAVPVDGDLFRQICLQALVRTKNPTGIGNHFSAIMSSYQLHQEALSKIKVPTMIIHGDEDPVFGLDHAAALNKAIADSKLIIVPGLGHGITNTVFYNPIIEGIVKSATVN